MDPHFDGIIYQTYAAELARRAGHSFPGVVIVDVRSAAAYAGGHIRGAISTSAVAGDLAAHLEDAPDVVVVGDLPEDPEVRRTVLDLRAAGLGRVTELADGMHSWREAGLPMESGTG